MRISLIGLVVAAGCASGAPRPQTPPPGTPRLVDPGTLAALTAERQNAYVDTVSTPPMATWRGLQEAYIGAGLTVDQVDSTHGWVVSRILQIRGRMGGVPLSRFVDCGRNPYGDNADSYVVEMRVSSQVGAGPRGGSVVQSAMSAAGNAPGNHERTSRCYSTGKLERQIAAIAAQLAR